MENFRLKFLEEAQEHISDIEQALLTLEDNPGDINLVEKVFRAMHSLKGGGAMFGFENISEFTHNLETIYDEIRNGKLNLSEEIFTLTLESVDHIKTMLNIDNEFTDEQKQLHQLLLQKIAEVIDNSTTDTQKNQQNPENKKPSKGATYYINFKPFENILDNGTNPLYLIDELTELGDTLVYSNLNNLPDIDRLNPLACYIHWEIILSTEHDENDINDVFIFVEDLCEIEIEKLSNKNLLKNSTFKTRLSEIGSSQTPIGLQTIAEIAKSVTSSVASKVKKAISGSPIGKQKTIANTISSIRVSSEKLDELMNLVSELVTTQARLALYTEQQESSELTAISENVQKLSRQLRDLAFNVVLVPIETLITRFHRLVRDLSHELGKEIAFRSEGTDTELDKTIIESLTDPLLHIIRNSIDHGIEDAAVREKKGKSPNGEILLKSFYSGANVVIQIIDDGAGINPEKIKNKAIEKNIITKDTTLSNKEIFDLLFLPGFSTANSITDVSGRGVGMDVVKQQVSKIRGEIEIDSEIDKGTTLTLKLPLTLSIIDGLLVQVEETYFVIPLSAVEKIHAIQQKTLFSQFNNLVVLDGEQVPYLYLRDEFEIGKTDKEQEQLIVVRYEDKKVGLVVDAIIGEYQAVLKPLGHHYKKQDIISGATILGDGTVALVLDTNKTVTQFALQNT